MPSADNCEMLLQDLQEDLGILQNGSPGWESGVLILGSLAVIYANYVLYKITSMFHNFTMIKLAVE